MQEDQVTDQDQLITDVTTLPAKLTAKQVAALLQVSVSIIYVWVEKKIIPFEQPPLVRTIRFDKAKLLAWWEGETKEVAQ